MEEENQLTITDTKPEDDPSIKHLIGSVLLVNYELFCKSLTELNIPILKEEEFQTIVAMKDQIINSIRLDKFKALIDSVLFSDFDLFCESQKGATHSNSLDALFEELIHERPKILAAVAKFYIPPVKEEKKQDTRKISSIIIKNTGSNDPVEYKALEYIGTPLDDQELFDIVQNNILERNIRTIDDLKPLDPSYPPSHFGEVIMYHSKMHFPIVLRKRLCILRTSKATGVMAMGLEALKGKFVVYNMPKKE